MSQNDNQETFEVVSYICPVCGEENHADSKDALVTCMEGHHLSLSSLPDENGRVAAEELPHSD